MLRGAELYDLFMLLRHDRKAAKLKGIWTLLCAMATHWRNDDEAKRGGRPSWHRMNKSLESSAWARAKVVNWNATGQRMAR